MVANYYCWLCYPYVYASEAAVEVPCSKPGLMLGGGTGVVPLLLGLDASPGSWESGLVTGRPGTDNGPFWRAACSA